MLSLLLVATACLQTVLAYTWPEVNGTYKIQRQWKGDSFFDGWNFITYPDPTHGCIRYVSKNESLENQLISTNASHARMAVESVNTYTTCERKSVRIESQELFNNGLFILDLSHMPEGCGTWPAWWSFFQQWPNGGEIDVIEGVHLQTHMHSALHTTDGCDMGQAPDYDFTGTWNGGIGGQLADDCYINAADQWSNQGCAIRSDEQDYGSPLNSAGGGVVAHEWSTDGIRMWSWLRGSVPKDIRKGNPNPDDWGEPYAAFPFGDWCPPTKFYNHTLTFDTTLCGDWAGDVWGTSGCQNLAATCDEYVMNNPSAFEDAFWLIDSLKVYKLGSSSSATAFKPLIALIALSLFYIWL